MENSSNMIHGHFTQEGIDDLASTTFDKRLDYLENWITNERKLRRQREKIEQIGFENTCPVMLSTEQLANPKIIIENFFRNNDLTSAKSKLKNWFKTALTEDLQYENGNELLFFHNQIIQLLHAGYLIVQDKSFDQEKSSLEHLVNNPAMISCLDINEQRSPLAYVNAIITVSNLTFLRYGMQEWLYSALSKRSSISQLNSKFIFEQFELLEKLFEALFLFSTRVLNR